MRREISNKKTATETLICGWAAVGQSPDLSHASAARISGSLPHARLWKGVTEVSPVCDR